MRIELGSCLNIYIRVAGWFTKAFIVCGNHYLTNWYCMKKWLWSCILRFNRLSKAWDEKKSLNWIGYLILWWCNQDRRRTTKLCWLILVGKLKIPVHIHCGLNRWCTVGWNEKKGFLWLMFNWHHDGSRSRDGLKKTGLGTVVWTSRFKLWGWNFW